MAEIDHEYTDEVVCPWCGYVHIDSWEWEDDDGEDSCYKCDKVFTYTRHFTVEYSTEKKEQAND